MAPLASAAAASLPVRGYAYSGNGTKIIRCEVSLDDGASWRLAEVTHRAPPNAHGKHWAWVWWSIDIPVGEGGGRGGACVLRAWRPALLPLLLVVLPLACCAARRRRWIARRPPDTHFLAPPSPAAADLLTCPEICCRAWDSCMNTQPNTFTWNVMGMMNNCVYRVKIHPRPATGGCCGCGRGGCVWGSCVWGGCVWGGCVRACVHPTPAPRLHSPAPPLPPLCTRRWRLCSAV